MESGNSTVVPSNEGIGAVDTETLQESNVYYGQPVGEPGDNRPFVAPSTFAAAEAAHEQERKDAAFAKLPRQQQLRALRGQFFTVKHVLLTDCGHRLDVINEPRHRNCDNCWFAWLNMHPTLIDTVHEAWQQHGKELVIKLRGKHFTKMFGRFMATVVEAAQEGKLIHEQKESQEGFSGQNTAGMVESSDLSSRSTDGG
jgi:hypothetical protein